MTLPRVVVPLTFPDAASHPVSESAAGTLEGFAVTLFGYWETDQSELTDTQQATAQRVLYETAAELAGQGIPTEVQLECGPGDDRQRRLEAVTDRVDADATLVVDRLPVLGELLVPVKHDRNAAAIVNVLSGFDPDSLIEVTLYHATEGDRDRDEIETMLQEFHGLLAEAGFPEAILKVEIEETDDALFAIKQRADRASLTVVGATEEYDAADRIFGSASEYLVEESDTPVLVVR